MRALIEAHHLETGSPLAEEMLRNWSQSLARFWQICPKEMLSRLAHPVEPASAIAAE